MILKLNIKILLIFWLMKNVPLMGKPIEENTSWISIKPGKKNWSTKNSKCIFQQIYKTYVGETINIHDVYTRGWELVHKIPFL